MCDLELPDLLPGNDDARAGGGSSLDSAKVAKAIKSGVAYLKVAQLPDGGWREQLPQNCGVSTLITLALLSAAKSRLLTCVER